MNQEKINVSQAPSIILGLCHWYCLFFTVVVVPEFHGYKNVFTLYEAVFDGAENAFASFFFVLVIVGAVEESVTRFDSLQLFE